jgi:hypothetical protein
MGTASVKIFQPKATVRYPSVTIPDWMGSIPGLGMNPMDGVVLDYYLKEKADTILVTLEIFDISGKLLRKYSNKKNDKFKPFAGGPPPPQVIPAEAGVNRFAWDFRTEVLPEIPNAFVYGDYRGHRIAPGKYKARISYKGEQSETEFDIVQDPNLTAASADWTAQQQFMEEIEARIAEIHASVNSTRKVKKQLEAHQELFASKEEWKEVVTTGKALIKKLESWEENLVQTKQKNFQDVINFPSKLNTEYFNVRSVLDVHDPRVTQGAKDRFADLEKQWVVYKQEIKSLEENEMKAYNDLFKQQNIPALIVERK